MKLLIAFDDSDASRAALNSLCSAGLPDEVDAVILTVEAVDNVQVLDIDAVEPRTNLVMPVFGTTGTDLDRALVIASDGETSLRRLFPHWRIRAAARGASSPAAGILEEIDASRPDMVVIGSHHRSTLGRIIHGSVAQKVLAAAHCSLRIGHTDQPATDTAMRIVAGVDGSDDSEAAVQEIARRSWPAGSVVSVIGVTNGLPFDIAQGAFYDSALLATAWSRRDLSRGTGPRTA